MMKGILWFISAVMLALLQTMWPDIIKIQGAGPELVLILVVYFAIAEGEEWAMYSGLIGGVYIDVASSTTLGHHVLGFVIVGFATARISTRLITEHPAVKAGLVLCASAASLIIFYAIEYVQQPDQPFFNLLVLNVVPSSFFTAVISPVFFFIFAFLFRPKQSVGSLIR